MKRMFIPAALAGLLALAGCSKAADASAFNPMEVKLDRLVLPTMPDPAGASLEEALEYLRVKTRDMETDDSFTKGINLVLIGGEKAKLTAGPAPKLTQVTAGKALHQITQAFGLKYRVDSHAVVIGTAEHFKLRRPQLSDADAPTDREKRLLHSLRHSLKPTITFQDTTIDEAVEFIRTGAGCLDIGDCKPAMGRTPNVVLKLSQGLNHPHITIDLKDIPMAEALCYLAEMAGLKISLRSSAAVFSDQDLGPPPVAQTKRSPLEVRASQMILPTMTFQGTTLTEALEFVHLKIRQSDPKHQDINIIVRPGDGKNQGITFDLKEITLPDLLDHIALQSGHRLSVEGESFILTPVGAAGL